MDISEMTWELIRELRTELVASQRIRTQVIGFKITFVSAAIGLIVAKTETNSGVLFTVPAVAAVFFDFIIYSYGFSIKRIGYYCRHHLEPLVRQQIELPDDFVQWEKFLEHPKTRQRLALLGNFGITTVAAGVAVFGLSTPFEHPKSTILLIVLGVLLLSDIWASRMAARFRERFDD